MKDKTLVFLATSGNFYSSNKHLIARLSVAGLANLANYKMAENSGGRVDGRPFARPFRKSP